MEQDMDHAAMEVAVKRLNDGEAVPEANPADMQKLWKFMPAWADNKAVGLTVARAEGVGIESLQGGGFVAIGMRMMLLDSLVRRGVLREFEEDEGLRAEVFRAAATLPLSGEDISEALALKRLPEMPADEADKLLAQMQAAGHDPEHPRIDEKFLSWIAEHTQKSE